MRGNRKSGTSALATNLGAGRWGAMVFLTFTALPGCGGAVDTADITSMGMSRSECHGSCPSYDVRIYRDGWVAYTGKKHVAQTGPQVSAVNPDAFAALASALNAMNFFRFRNEYTATSSCPESSSGAASVTFYATHEGGKKQVSYYYGCVGLAIAKPLENLAKLIDETAKTSQWVGSAPTGQYDNLGMK